MSKTFALNSIIPRITSVTKTESVAKNPNLKRATGRVITLRSASKRSVVNTVASARAKSVASPMRAARAISKFFSGNWVGFASAAGLVIIVIGMGSYVAVINASASQGYELKHEQAVIDDLNETQKQLMIQQAALGSIVKVNDVASTAGMVPVTGEEFLVANQLSKR
ncbi:MAG TPA: hypothetical protein VHQ41_02970 [Patescibacteria group bacterium]|jgi:hypothetical protein|nr:hypothetical protein [Patescibacteria group bacterium]